MSTHQTTGASATGSRTAHSDPAHALNVRVLRFRHSPHREDPSLLAHELLEVGRNEDALELVEMALAREPGDADLELLRGRALLSAGEVSRAQETLIRAAKAAPGWAAPFTWLTRALSAGSDSSRAGAMAVRAKSLGADDAQIVRLAKGHETAERLDARIARYESSPESEEPVMLARELLLVGRSDDASGVLRFALERDREDPDTLAALAQLERTLGRTDEAVALLRRARSVAPDWEPVERALYSLVGVEVLLEPDETAASIAIEAAASIAIEPEREISVAPLAVCPATTAADMDGALDALLAEHRDDTVPYRDEARDTEHGTPAIDATLVGVPAPACAPIETSNVRHDLAHGRIRRAGATGWPRRVMAKPEPVASPYVRVLVGDARPRMTRN